MNILMLTHHIPLPLTDGGRIRDFNILRRMALNNNVTLCCFTSGPEHEDAVAEIEAMGVRVAAIPRRRRVAFDLARALVTRRPYHTIADERRHMRQAIAQAAQTARTDVVYCSFLLSMSQYLPLVPGPAVRVLDQHNLDHTVWQRAAEADPSLLRRMISKAVAASVVRYERQHLSEFNLIFSVSETDLEGTRRLITPDTRTCLAPNGVDLSYFAPAGEPPADTEDVVFAASMDMRMNVDAVTWFVRETWPKIKAEVPRARFWAVGREPTAEVIAIHNGSDIFVTGTVPDIREYLGQASVVVVPSRLGGGTKLKVLEAMATARPVVATTRGAQGINAVDGREILIAESPSEQAAAVVRLLQDKTLARSLGASARVAVEANYGWDAIWFRMEQAIRSEHDARTQQRVD